MSRATTWNTLSSHPLQARRGQSRRIVLCPAGPDLNRQARRLELEKVVTCFLQSEHAVLEKGDNFVVDTTSWLDGMEIQTLQSLCQLTVGSIKLKTEPDPLFIVATELQSSTRPETIRVKDIPAAWGIEKLEAALFNHFHHAPKVHSFARAYPDGHGWQRQATVTFPSMLNSAMKDRLQAAPSIKGSISFDTKFMHVTVLYDGNDTVGEARVDIIAIEGLGTNAFGTFRALQGDEMWLRDFLPQNISDCRVLLYGYNSKVDNSTSDATPAEMSTTIMNNISDFRKLTKTANRPIIWIGQSMGGLIIQEVLIQSKDLGPQNLTAAQSPNPTLFRSSIGFIGFGVPTKGLRNDSLLLAVENQPNKVLVKSICLQNGEPSDYLVGLASRFELCKAKLTVHYFYETNRSTERRNPDAEPRRQVEDTEGIGRENHYFVPYNHSDLVKISDRGEETYITTVQICSLMMMESLDDGESAASLRMFRGRSRTPHPESSTRPGSGVVSQMMLDYPSPRHPQPTSPGVSVPPILASSEYH